MDVATTASGGSWLPRELRQVTSARVEMRDRERTDLHRPDPVGDLLKPDVMAVEGAAEKQDLLRPRDTPVGPDAPHLEMPEIVEGRQTRRQGSRRASIVGTRRGLPEGLVGPIVVVFAAKAAKPALLREGGARRRASRFRFEHGVELLMRAVLFRVARQNAFGANAQLQPPHGEARQPAQAGAGEGGAIIAAQAEGQAVLRKGAREAVPRRRVGRA